MQTTKARKRRKLQFTPVYLTVAQWFWQCILEMHPAHKPPSLDTWADAIRLLRERDGRTHGEIRALIERVERDEFWRKNVLCPSKLRDQWDQLHIKLGPAAAPAQHSRLGHDFDKHPRHQTAATPVGANRRAIA